ncbi:MAG: hypothetical protein K5886_03425 [Lachnospiraceae bacterium]|nr:hypothetical protein [Lachnospiraceae bacterium]
MINNDMINRLKKAAGYQKQAIRALLPEGMGSHLDVIEGEVKEMVAELISAHCPHNREEDGKTSEGVKKVNID